MADLKSIVEELDSLTIPESEELVTKLENLWGVKANPWGDMALPPPGPKEEAPAQTEFDVELTSFPDGNKIPIVKALRVVTGLGLREAMELAKSAPVVIKEQVSEGVANDLKGQLEAEGAVVTLK